MRTRADRLRTTASIAFFAAVLAGVAYGTGLLVEVVLFRIVGIGLLLLGWAVFAPLYFLYASWLDERRRREAADEPLRTNRELENE